MTRKIVPEMTRNVSSGTLNPTILYYLRSLENHRLTEVNLYFIPLDSRGNYGATSNNTKLVHWPLMGGLLHLVQRRGAYSKLVHWPLMGGLYIWFSEEGPGRAAAPSSPLLTVPNVTASVPITVLLYDGPLLCGFNVAIKGLKSVKRLCLCW